MTNTKTRKQYFEEIKALIAPETEGYEDYMAFLDKEATNASKRYVNEEAKAKKAQADNAVREQIMNVLMNSAEAMTATAIAQAVGISTQKATSLMSVEGFIRVVNKGKAYYSLA